MFRLPKPPDGYRPATLLERRTTPAVLAHNRRLGWLLHLAERHGVVPAPDTDPEALSELVRLLLPDLFPADVDPAPYVADTADRDLALGLLGDHDLVEAELPTGRRLVLAISPDAALDGLKVVSP